MIERTSKANNFLIMNSKGEWGRSHLPRLSSSEPFYESKVDLVKENNFSSTEKEWNNIENSTKAEDNLNSSNGKVHLSKQTFSDFWLAKPNFKVRKKLKLN